METPNEISNLRDEDYSELDLSEDFRLILGDIIEDVVGKEALNPEDFREVA